MQANLFMKSAVLIEQNPVMCRLYSDILNANGFNVYVANSAMDGLMKIRENRQDLAVINTEIAEDSFIEKFVNKIKSEKDGKFMPIIGLSVYREDCKKNIAKILDAFLTKPVSIDRFMESIFECIEKKNDGCESSNN